MKKLHLHLVLILCFNFLMNLTIDAQSSVTGKTYGLLIAIDNYADETWQPLKTTQKDAAEIKRLLEDKYEFDEVLTLYNEKATRTTILDYINKITDNVEEEDKFLIFYSGHGKIIGEEGYWIPYDAKNEEVSSLVPNSDIKNALGKANCKHILVLSDGCFQGRTFKSSNLGLKNTGEDSYYEMMETLMSRQAMSSGGVSPDADGDGQHSTFAKYLIKFLEKNNKPLLAADELYGKIRVPVASNSPNMPQLGYIQDTGHEGGQFIFRLKEDKICDKIKVSLQEGKSITFEEEGGTLNALVEDVTKVSFEWLKGTAPIGGNETSLKVTESGTYTVLISDGEGCNDAAIIDVNVELPQVYVSIEEGSQVQYTFRGVLHAVASRDDLVYEWRRNGFTVGDKPNLEVRQSGEYAIILKTKDGRVISTAKTNVTIRDRTYVVKVGDNLERIARKFYRNPDKASLLYSANASQIDADGTLKIGTEITIPADISDEEANKSIQLVANRSFTPLSAAGLYEDGMLTDMVKQTFQEFSDQISIDFLELDKAKVATSKGRYTASFPMTKTAEDADQFLFSEPIYAVLNVLFKKNGSDIKFEKDKNLKGLKIAVVRGFTENKLTSLSNERVVRLYPCNSPTHGFELLQAGTVDLLMLPQIVGLGTLASSTTLKEDNYEMLPKEISTSTLHIGISKKHPKGLFLMQKFNAAFQQLTASGLIDKIQDKHLDLFQTDRP